MKTKMTSRFLAAMCGACVLTLAAGSFAQESKPAVPAKAPAKPQAAQPATATTPAKTAAPKAAEPPAGMDEAAMMEAYMKAAAPGPEHAHLQKACGQWDGKVKMWMAPGTTPSESTCTTTITSMLGGRFTKAETKGSFDMGGAPMPFEGFGTYGYNNTTKKFESTWMDSMGTITMYFTGTGSPDFKTVTTTAHFVDPASGKDSYMKNVEKFTGPDTMVLAMYGPGPDGKEFQMMEISYTRKAGAKADAKTVEGKPLTGGK